MRIPLSVKEIEIRGNGRGGLANRKEAPEEDPFSSLAADPSLKIDASLPRVVSSLLAFHPIVFLLFWRRSRCRERIWATMDGHR